MLWLNEEVEDKMANMIAKLVIFSILLNLAAGIMMTAVVDNSGNKVFDSTAQGGYNFMGEGYEQDFQLELEKDIQPSGNLEDEGDQIYRVLDVMSLGFIYKFIKVVDKYMFGFINMLDNIIGQHLDDDTRAILFGNQNDNDLIPNNFGVFKIIVSISYILMGISLFTGKDVVE